MIIDQTLLPENSVVFYDQPWNHEPGKNNILILFEPEVIGHMRNPTINNIHNFHTVYTCDDVILRMFPEKAKKYVGNWSCFKGDVSEKDNEKFFKISTIVGWKLFPGVPGHYLRQRLYYNQEKFPENFIFFRSSAGEHLPALKENPFVPADIEGKKVLFDGFQFSMVIENSRQVNYFTEKLLDCLIMRTVPIYWGCPNIGEFFDTSGWIFFDDMNDLLEKIKRLTPDYYNRYLETIEKNHLEAMKYRDESENFNRQART
jgi:hypothetical protein